jgi:hypothetical protein
VGVDATLRDRWGIYSFNEYTGETNFVPNTRETATTELLKQDKALTYDETIAAGLTPKQGYTYIRKADGKYVILPNNSRVL